MSTLVALACPILRDQIDTDALIPIGEYTKLSATGFGPALFAAWRYTNVEARQPDPDFILNRSPFDRAQILISGHNFGCGSSREAAVWALRDFGFRAVLAVSFNETFVRNAIANRMWPLRLSAHDAERIVEAVLAAPERPVELSLTTLEAVAGDVRAPVAIDPYYRQLL